VTSISPLFATGLSDDERERLIKETEEDIAEMERKFEAHPDVVLAMFLNNHRLSLKILKQGDAEFIPAVYEPPTADGDSR